MPLHYEVGGGVVRLTLDEPASRNALGTAILHELRAGIATAAGIGARVVVISHTGPVFCSGMDLRETAGAPAGDQPVTALPALLAEIAAADVPVVARVGGRARAGGIGLFAACDIVIAARSADFAFSEVRLGLAPAVISAVVLPRMSPAAARELFLTGETFLAARAAATGLVDRVVDDAELDAEVERYVGLLLQAGPQASTETKRLLRRERSADLTADLAAMSAVSARMFAAAEGQEGTAAFREKRPPRWSTPH